VNLWKWYIEQYGGEMRKTQFSELFEGLTMLYGVESTPGVNKSREWKSG
jgi:hypothetical protein